jgi:hypothetical protein
VILASSVGILAAPVTASRRNYRPQSDNFLQLLDFSPFSAFSGLFQPFSTFSRSSLGNERDADEGAQEACCWLTETAPKILQTSPLSGA